MKTLEYVSCACTAASVAMVIYACSPRVMEPLCRGSPEDLLETEDGTEESHSAPSPKRVSLNTISCCECFGAGVTPLEYSRGGA